MADDTTDDDLQLTHSRPVTGKDVRISDLPPGAHIEFSDFDGSDNELPRPKKKRKAESTRPKAPSTTRIKRDNDTKKSSMVGRKPRRTNKPRKEKAILDSSDDEKRRPVETLPEHLRNWIDERDHEQKVIGGIAGLRFPPAEPDFEEGDNLANLREKPQLPDVDPPSEYKDVNIGFGQAVIPAPIAQYLKPYQIEGADFLMKKFVYQQGCILGDDMGLGKTIQVIAFLTAAFHKSGDERDAKRMRRTRRMGDDVWYPRVLLVCPGTLMANWRNELERWGWWHVYEYHGLPGPKEAAIAAAAKGRLEIMITTYDTYRMSESAINAVKWDCVIADECHKIKERKAEVTKAMDNINALCRIGLSGTAIQNKYEELWTLLNWSNPGKLGSIASWKTSICIPLKLGQSHDATMSQISKARRLATRLVKNLLPRFFLRRTKALIAHQLPKKSDRVVFCPLTETQADAYNNFCDHELVHAIRDSSTPCYCNSGKKQGWCCMEEVEGFGRWQHQVFPVLHTIAKLCNHVGLLVPSGEQDQERHDKDLQKCKIAIPDLWKDLYRKRDHLLTFANHEFCGKWKVLKKLLKLWHDSGDKVLVFSHSVRLLKMLHTLLNTTSYSISYLDGSMSYDDRQREVDKYNSDPSEFIFLISTKAGGVGLNITSANKVVVVDPNWNPAYDLQAQDRAYRIGQTRDVEVFRLVSSGTIEEIIYARQIYKQQQANIGYNASVERRYFKGVQDEKDQKGEIFGLVNLFQPLKENVVLRDIVNKTNVAESKAGVSIAGLDLEASQEDEEAAHPLTDSAKEDAFMSQLAADIIDEPGARRKAAKETAKKKDPVQAILASAGVEYTHENAEVIGTSKIETKITSWAHKAGNDTDRINERAFAASQGDAQAENDVDGEVDLDDGLGTVHYKFRPPIEVRRRQFCTMAEYFGYKDITEFALVVEGMKQEGRRDLLEKFYLERRAKLAQEA